MKKIVYITFLACMISLLQSCKEGDRLMYEDDPRVYLLKNLGSNLDSIHYSFALAPVEKVTDTVSLRFRIMGLAKNYDRPINIVLQEGSNAVRDYHFKLDNAYIPANQSDGKVSLLFYRKAGMKDSVITGIIKVAESKDFQPGYFDNGAGVSRDRTTYKFTISDKLSKPAIWDSRWLSMFGAYSDVKIRFLTLATGYSNWNVAVSFPQDQNQMVQKARLALYELEKAEGPLFDEEGNRVVIP